MGFRVWGLGFKVWDLGFRAVKGALRKGVIWVRLGSQDVGLYRGVTQDMVALALVSSEIRQV